jgi:type II secretory pathway pseudopilin PulG
MIVALAVFSVVVTISVGALLSLIATNGQLQSERTVMTNLSFALDSMTREIRTGTGYYCEDANNYNQSGNKSVFRDGIDLDTVISNSRQDCPDGKTGVNLRPLRGVSFIEAGDSITEGAQRILYFYDAGISGNTSPDTEGKIFRKVGNNPAQSIVSSGIYIEDARFFVTGGAPLSDGTSNLDQPAVTIYIKARENVAGINGKSYEIQTTVVQRTLDI